MSIIKKQYQQELGVTMTQDGLRWSPKLWKRWGIFAVVQLRSFAARDFEAWHKLLAQKQQLLA